MNMTIKRLSGRFLLGEPTASTGENANVQEMQILKTGQFFDPRYKEFIITEKHLAEMVENFHQGVRGIVPALDYMHETDGPAAGWFQDLFIKDGEKGQKELWAKVELTPKGQKTLSDKEFAYLSADFNESYVDNETGKKYGCVLLGAALTNRPVIKRMQPAIQLAEASDAVSEKIKKLIAEGKSQDQAVAIALEMERKNQLNEGGEMTPEQQKKLEELEMECAEAKKQLADYKKMGEDMGAQDPAALMKMIADLKAELAAMKSGQKPDEKIMGDMQKELSELRTKNQELSKKIELSEKESEFTKLLSEGKVVAAQREAFISGDVKKFAELSEPVKTTPAGHGHSPAGGGADVDDEIMTQAKKLSEEKGISIRQAIETVLETNKQLSEKRK